MRLTPPGLPHGHLGRPRLLPAAIVAMSALLAVKCVVMVQAVAGEATTPVQADAAPPRNASQGAPSPSAVPPSQPAGKPSGAALQPPISEAERAILMDLRQRRETLDNRARELDTREAEISAADRRLADRVQQLSKLQDKLESLETARQRHSDENWTGLVKVYEAMKPRDAAAIFDSLDMQVLLQVIDRMQDRRSGARAGGHATGSRPPGNADAGRDAHPRHHAAGSPVMGGRAACIGRIPPGVCCQQL